VAFRVLERESCCDTALPAPQAQEPLLGRVKWDLAARAFLAFAVQRAQLV